MNIHDPADLQRRLAAYLCEQTGRHWQLGVFTRYAVGFSWITYGFSASRDGETLGLILRLGPPYGLFAPYSALPEYRALKALEGSAVPVPRAFWWSDDSRILGAPFCITEKMSGEAPVPWGEAGFAQDWRLGIGRQFVSALAALHRVDWRQAEGFDSERGISAATVAQAQIDFWDAARQRWALRDYPILHYAMLWLRERAPTAPHVALIHGDYRLGNFLEENGRITAILDWELTHLGDPHEDLGWAFLPQYAMGSGLICRLLPREDFIAQYEAEIGFKVSPESLLFYQVLALVKLALTHVAAVRCFEDGRFDDMRMPAMGTQIAPTLRQIQKLLMTP